MQIRHLVILILLLFSGAVAASVAPQQLVPACVPGVAAEDQSAGDGSENTQGGEEEEEPDCE